MDKQLRIRVTQEDIDQGEVKDVNKCPVARAMKRALGDYYVRAAHHVLEWATPNGRYTASTPIMARWFMISFDIGRAVKPFEMTLDPDPEPIHRHARIFVDQTLM